MAAHIQQSVDFVVITAHDNDRLTPHFEQEPVADFRNFTAMAGIEPTLQVDFLYFTFINISIGVKRPLQCGAVGMQIYQIPDVLFFHFPTPFTISPLPIGCLSSESVFCL